MDSERQKKILMMKIGVITVIVLIFILWVFNIRNVWRPITLDSNNPSENSDLSNFKNDINKQMTEINSRLSSIVNLKQEAQTKAGDELLNNLIKETDKISSSSAATSTATSSTISGSTSTPAKLKNNNCPAYIDCMPTIGAAKTCQIPTGCEGITVIAY